tara:strand:+ start:110 stop:352 length:243 start_codon:yes stop_codon:yes gene_type:complete
MKRKTQHDVVIEHLRKYKTITSWDAIIEYGITRLATRVFELKELGYNIPTERITVKTRLGNTTSIAKYSLIEKPIQASLF